jgi:hypothetical protein
MITGPQLLESKMPLRIFTKINKVTEQVINGACAWGPWLSDSGCVPYSKWIPQPCPSHQLHDSLRFPAPLCLSSSERHKLEKQRFSPLCVWYVRKPCLNERKFTKCIKYLKVMFSYSLEEFIIYLLQPWSLKLTGLGNLSLGNPGLGLSLTLVQRVSFCAECQREVHFQSWKPQLSPIAYFA